jgi:hypothetical protein
MLKSFISNKTFPINYENNQTNLYSIKSEIPQGTVLGPFLHVLYTTDLPQSEHKMFAKFADDTQILPVHIS